MEETTGGIYCAGWCGLGDYDAARAVKAIITEAVLHLRIWLVLVALVTVFWTVDEVESH